jgi:glycosyltransferase involved in cell wall biosynthesis
MANGSKPFSFHQFLVSREFGGAGAVALHVADHLRRVGRAATVWVPGRGPAWDEVAKLGLPAREYDAASAFSDWRLRAAWANWKLGAVLRRRRPGLLHVHAPHFYGALRGAFRRSGLLRVVHVHLESDNEGLRWAFRQPPELIVTCARFLVEQVRDTLPETFRKQTRIVAVPNAVDVEKFTPSDKGAAKEKVQAPADRPLVLMLANLAPHKGQETAIRAAALLKARGVEAAFWLAGTERGGEDAFTARLRSLVEELGVGDRVRLLGHRGDAPELLRAADFFLLPSTKEGLPLSILEAQASKVPVLAAPTAGVPEVVGDGETGFLIAADDADGYAQRLEVLMREPSLARRVADVAHATVVRDHHWDAYCRRMDALYDELIQPLSTGGRSPRSLAATTGMKPPAHAFGVGRET